MHRTDTPLVVLTLRVPAAHAAAVRAYADTLAKMTRLRVSPSAAGAAVLETGLIGLGLIEASESEPSSTPPAATNRAASAAKKGAKRKAGKP